MNHTYKYQYKYNNIDELNSLLILHKPNVIFEASLWLETYSYTLTISMLTQLPILYLKKNKKSVIENRLSKYNKSYVYDNIIDFFELVQKVKQNYFYTIEPKIYYSSFWDEIFNDNKIINLNNKNVVLITSKIYVSKTTFSYVNTRSIYTVEERFNQTLETIDSIKKYIPNSYIILFDNSIFEKNEYFKTLNEKVDKFINITDNKLLNYYTNDYIYKAFAEINQQLVFYNSFLKYVNINSIKNFFKISGRYLINNNFIFNNFDNKLNIFKKNIKVKDRKYFYTCFYKLNPSFLPEYFNKLQNLLDNKKKYENSYSDFEVIVPNVIYNNISQIEELGITERIAVFNEINNI